VKKEIITLTAAVISLITALVGAIGTVKSNLPWAIAFTILVIMLLILSAILYFWCLNRKTEVDNYSFFHKIMHELRNYRFELLKVYSDRDKEGRTSLLAEKYLKTGVKNAIGELCNLLNNNKVGKKNISVCVKLLKKNSQNELCVTTLCRKTENNNRRNLDVSLYALTGNTGLNDVYQKQCSEWSCADLNKLYGYVNFNQNWREQYTSTLIIPIRIQRTYLHKIESFHIENGCRDGNYVFLGFLCADSIDAGAFGLDGENNIFRSAMSATADALFSYIDHCQHLIAKYKK
jgi:hypothetical protein